MNPEGSQRNPMPYRQSQNARRSLLEVLSKDVLETAKRRTLGRESSAFIGNQGSLVLGSGVRSSLKSGPIGTAQSHSQGSTQRGSTLAEGKSRQSIKAKNRGSVSLGPPHHGGVALDSARLTELVGHVMKPIMLRLEGQMIDLTNLVVSDVEGVRNDLAGTAEEFGKVKDQVVKLVRGSAKNPSGGESARIAARVASPPPSRTQELLKGLQAAKGEHDAPDSPPTPMMMTKMKSSVTRNLSEIDGSQPLL